MIFQARYDWGVYVVPYRALSSLGQLDVSKQINVTLSWGPSEQVYHDLDTREFEFEHMRK